MILHLFEQFAIYFDQSTTNAVIEIEIFIKTDIFDENEVFCLFGEKILPIPVSATNQLNRDESKMSEISPFPTK